MWSLMIILWSFKLQVGCSSSELHSLIRQFSRFNLVLTFIMIIICFNFGTERDWLGHNNVIVVICCSLAESGMSVKYLCAAEVYSYQ